MNNPLCPNAATQLTLHELTLRVFSLLCIASVGLAEDAASQADVLREVNQLGSASFVAREDATQRLLQFGEFAKPELLKASRSNDREVRDRSRRVLALIERQRREGQLTAFRDGIAVPNEDDSLPGWKKFSERYGKESASRDLYSKMLDSEWDLLQTYFTDATEAERRSLSSARYLQLQSSQIGYQNYDIGTMLSFFFLAAEEPSSFDLHGQLYSFVRHRKMHQMLTGSSKSRDSERRLVRSLVGDWIVAASGPHLNDRLALQTTLLYKMHDEGSVIAKRVLVDKTALPLSKSMAMQAIVLRNDTSQAKLITPFLEDKTRLSTTGQRERQLRDVALACLMQLNGHDVRKIGVKILSNATHSAFDYNTLGFTSEADRQKAFDLFAKLQSEKKHSR